MNNKETENLFESAVSAIATGEEATLSALLQQHPELIRARSAAPHHATLLHYIADNGFENCFQKYPANAVALARMLLDAGAEVDARAFDNGPYSTTLIGLVTSWPPFAAGVQTALVEVLLDAGAAIEGLTGDGAPLGFALSFGYTAAAETLARRGARYDNLLYASGLGRLDLVSSYVAPEGSVQLQAINYPRHEQAERGRFGWPPPRDHDPRAQSLIYACIHGRTEVVRYLLATGAAVNAAPSFAQTPLHFAAYMGHDELVRLLLERGADPTVRERQFGRTPAEWAAETDNHDIADYLQELIRN